MMKLKILRELVRQVFDVAPSFGFPFRMTGGIPGDVNRTHPASIEPAIQSNTPVTLYGQPCLIAADGTNGVRPFGVGDGAVTTAYGIAARPFPVQAQSTSGTSFTAGQSGAQPFGTGVPPGAGYEIDVMRYGYMTVLVPTDAAAAAKGGAVFVWIAASAGTHTQGGFETAASGGNTIALDANRYQFNGPQDSSGNIELFVR